MSLGRSEGAGVTETAPEIGHTLPLGVKEAETHHLQGSGWLEFPDTASVAAGP